MDYFQQLLWDLGEIIEVPLHIDQNHACKLLLDEHLQVQMEMDSYEEHLLIAAYISEIPPGRFRENVLQDTLKVNSTYQPFGFFSYIEKTNQLVLYKKLMAENLSGDKLAQFLLMFIEEAEEWYKALSNSQSAPLKYHTYESKSPNFNLLR